MSNIGFGGYSPRINQINTRKNTTIVPGDINPYDSNYLPFKYFNQSVELSPPAATTDLWAALMFDVNLMGNLILYNFSFSSDTNVKLTVSVCADTIKAADFLQLPYGPQAKTLIVGGDSSGYGNIWTYTGTNIITPPALVDILHVNKFDFEPAPLTHKVNISPGYMINGSTNGVMINFNMATAAAPKLFLNLEWAEIRLPS